MTPSAPPTLINAITKINSMLASEGSKIMLIEVNDSAVTVRLHKGSSDPACTMCAIDEDSIQMLIKEAIMRDLPTINNVTVVAA
jgi:Fe-S cluster biogenesis protein NfuA